MSPVSHPHHRKHPGRDGPSTCGQDANKNLGCLQVWGQVSDARIPLSLGQPGVNPTPTPAGQVSCHHDSLSPDCHLCVVGAQRCVSFESCVTKMMKGSEGLIYEKRLKKQNPCSLAEP